MTRAGWLKRYDETRFFYRIIITILFLGISQEFAAKVIAPGDVSRQKGHQAFNNGQFRDAILYLERTLELEPYSSQSHYDLGRALLYRKDIKPARSPVARQEIYLNYKRAAKHIRKSLEIVGYLDFGERKSYMMPYAEYHFHLAQAYWFAGLWDRALTHFRRTVLLDEKFLEAYYNMAAIYESQNQWWKAECYFRLYLREQHEQNRDQTDFNAAFQQNYNPVRDLRCYK